MQVSTLARSVSPAFPDYAETAEQRAAQIGCGGGSCGIGWLQVLVLRNAWESGLGLGVAGSRREHKSALAGCDGSWEAVELSY